MFERFWPVTEECLPDEANSFSALLGRLRQHTSSDLIGDGEWQAILNRAQDLPPTFGAFPFGYELPLHEATPRADFGVSVLGGGLTAAFFQDSGGSRKKDATVLAVARFLDETDNEDSALRRVTGRKLLLEYDIPPANQGNPPAPGIFLYPAPDILIGDQSSARAQGIGVVMKALGAASGLGAETSEIEHAQQVYMAMRQKTAMRAIGVFPARGRGFRLAVTGFESGAEVADFLKHAGWPGNHALAASTLARFEQIDAFGYAGIHLDVGTAGLGPALGVSIYPGHGEWIRDFGQWKPLLEPLRQDALAVPEKLDALAESSSGLDTLYGVKVPFAFLRGIHHVKLTLSGDHISSVKAYLFSLLIALRPPAAPS